MRIPAVLILLMFLLFGASRPAFCAVYYVDVAAGDDAAAGDSPEAPWRTLAKVSHTELAPGDQVLLRRGRIWRERFEPPASGTAEAPIRFGAYGDGPRPSLRGSDDFSDPTDWAEKDGLWYAPGFQEGAVLIHDGRPGRLVPEKSELAEPWDYWHDALRARLYVRLDKNPATAATVEAAVREFVIGPIKRDHLVFENLDLRHATNIVLISWGAKDITLKNCVLAESAVNLTQFNNGSGAVRIESCTFSDWNLACGLGYAVQAIQKGSGPVDVVNCRFEGGLTGCGEDHTAIMNDFESWIREVRGCLFLGDGGKLADDGVVIWRPAQKAESVTVADNIFLGLGGAAISIQELEHYGAAPVVRVTGNLIRDAGQGDDEDKEALRLRIFTKTSDVEVSNNLIIGTARGKNPHHGIESERTENARILGNTVTGADDGIHLKRDVMGLIVKNNLLVTNRGFGVMAGFGTKPETISGNCVSGNAGGPYDGLSAPPGDLAADPGLDEHFHPAPDGLCKDAGARLSVPLSPPKESAGAAPD